MLSDAFLARLDALALRMRHAAGGGAGGVRRSKALGSSVEFSDFREYVLGDDIRRVDWNAYARFDRLFVKLFMEEREQQVHLLLDASASMDFGKWENAKKLVETLAYLALCGGDRVTAYTLGEETRHTRPLQGRQSYPTLTAFLEQARPSGALALGKSVDRLTLSPGRGAAVLVSDLLTEDGYERALQSLLYRRQEVSVLQIWSPAEWEPELEGVLELTDSETGERVPLTADYETLKRYRQVARAYVEEAATFCRAHGMTHAFLLSEDPFEEGMLRTFSRLGLIA